MNINKNIKTRSGFTLIELLTVIAIIGILAGILIPTIGLVRKNASKAKSSSNLRQIALGYNSFSVLGSRIRSVGSASFDLDNANTSAATRAEWARVIAMHGDLNEASLYYIESAGAAPSVIPQSIINTTDNTLLLTTSDQNRISYEMAVGTSSNARTSILPLIWTRGYDQTNANWFDGPEVANASGVITGGSPWEGEGGHICFADAHVNFFTSTGNYTAPTGTEDGYSNGQLTRNNGTADATIQGVLSSVGGSIVVN